MWATETRSRAPMLPLAHERQLCRQANGLRSLIGVI